MAKGWSKEYSCCMNCAKDSSPHKEDGLCRECYSKRKRGKEIPEETWRYYGFCSNCRTTKFPHKAKGLCGRCYDTWFERRNRPKKWHCVECGLTAIPHASHGLCQKCYGIQYGKQPALYDTYAYQINCCEEVRRDPNNFKYLQVKCTESSCRKWFTPTTGEVSRRLIVINSVGGGNNFYCSEECKHNCSIYGRSKYRKGEGPDNSRPDQAEWGALVLERDDYTCQRCGTTENLEAHHLEGIYQNPLMSADVDMGITLCDVCHKSVHAEMGCQYVDLTRRSLCV